MSKVLVDFQEIEEYKNNKMCGSGKEGACYYLSNNLIIKIFHIFINNRVVHFDTFKDNNIAFPIDIYIDNLVKLETAYTMKYFKGVKMTRGVPKRIKIDDLKKAYIKMKKVINNYWDIYMVDMCLENILYDKDKNEFNLIDTSRWYPLFDCGSMNLTQFNNCLCYALLSHNLDWVKNNNSGELLKLYNMFLNNEFINFNELLDIARYEMLKTSDKKVLTIGDLTPKVRKS